MSMVEDVLVYIAKAEICAENGDMERAHMYASLAQTVAMLDTRPHPRHRGVVLSQNMESVKQAVEAGIRPLSGGKTKVPAPVKKPGGGR